MNKFFTYLKSGLEEIILYKDGKIKLRSKLIYISDPFTDYKTDKIKNIRKYQEKK